MDREPQKEMSELSETRCTVCGRYLPIQTGRGRKKERHEHCNQLGKILVWLETELDDKAAYFDDGARQLIRTRLLMLCEHMDGEPYMGRKEYNKKVLGHGESN